MEEREARLRVAKMAKTMARRTELLHSRHFNFGYSLACACSVTITHTLGRICYKS